MLKLIDECQEHDYVWLKIESVQLPHPQLKTITKETFACVYCGAGLDFYNLDEPIIINQPKKDIL
jgi:hypothetical protein